MEKPVQNRKTRVNLLLCLLVAAGCWLMMELSKTYRVDYSYQLCLKNVPDSKTAVYQSDSVCTFTLEDKGLALLSADLRSKKLALDYDKLLTDYQKGRNSVRVSQSQLVEYLKQDRRFSGSLQTISLGSIHFNFENRPQTEKE
ncbi:MAG: hypothetical protein J6T56_01760 [Bacteroidales bacterium]|nr:hypothetical protein [Bacteroidales bacterium]